MGKKSSIVLHGVYGVRFGVKAHAHMILRATIDTRWRVVYMQFSSPNSRHLCPRCRQVQIIFFYKCNCIRKASQVTSSYVYLMVLVLQQLCLKREWFIL